MINNLKIIGLIGLMLFSIYGVYWIAKTGSYVLFYESMVEDTVRDMVKEEYLK